MLQQPTHFIFLFFFLIFVPNWPYFQIFSILKLKFLSQIIYSERKIAIKGKEMFVVHWGNVCAELWLPAFEFHEAQIQHILTNLKPKENDATFHWSINCDKS